MLSFFQSMQQSWKDAGIAQQRYRAFETLINADSYKDKALDKNGGMKRRRVLDPSIQELLDRYLADKEFFFAPLPSELRYKVRNSHCEPEDLCLFDVLVRRLYWITTGDAIISKIVKTHLTTMTKEEKEGVIKLFLSSTQPYVEDKTAVELLTLLITPGENYYAKEYTTILGAFYLIHCNLDTALINENGAAHWKRWFRKRVEPKEWVLALLDSLVDDKIVNSDDLLTYDNIQIQSELWVKIVQRPWVSVKHPTKDRLAVWMHTELNTDAYSKNAERVAKLLKILHKNQSLHPGFLYFIVDYIHSAWKNYERVTKYVNTLVKEFLYLNTSEFDFFGYRSTNGTTLRAKLEEAGCTKALKLISSVKQPTVAAVGPYLGPAIQQRDYECVICMEQRATVALLSCRHFGFCIKCANNLHQKRECPICRTPYSPEQMIELIYA